MIGHCPSAYQDVEVLFEDLESKKPCSSRCPKSILTQDSDNKRSGCRIGKHDLTGSQGIRTSKHIGKSRALSWCGWSARAWLDDEEHPRRTGIDVFDVYSHRARLQEWLQLLVDSAHESFDFAHFRMTVRLLLQHLERQSDAQGISDDFAIPLIQAIDSRDPFIEQRPRKRALSRNGSDEIRSTGIGWADLASIRSRFCRLTAFSRYGLTK